MLEYDCPQIPKSLEEGKASIESFQAHIPTFWSLVWISNVEPKT